MFVYSKSSGLNNAAIGKLETPIKMLIEHESNKYNQKGGICKWLFNIEKSNKYGETIVGMSDFDIFQAAKEGEVGAIQSVEETYHKFIEHIQFMKEFSITAEMMEDANFGLATDAKRRIENFTRAYYKTVDRICEQALIDSTKSSTYIAGTSLDLTTGDGEPLFTKNHKWGGTQNGGTQSNYYSATCFTDNDGTYNPNRFSEALAEAAGKLRNMRDESGDMLGYVADTIILPGNHTTLEMMVKKICGSEYVTGSPNNDINLNYGRWNIIVLPHWSSDNNECMIMSSDANKTLGGNMFFNRVPLTITNWVENHTGNYIWNGRCRFGVGFGTYKHIIRLTEDDTDTNATRL